MPAVWSARENYFRAASASDPAADAETAQRAQSTKKKSLARADIPEPKKRSALYKWWSGDNEEMDYQAATAAAAGVARAQTATVGASVLELLAGRAVTYGTWAARSASVAAGGMGAPVAELLVSRMPGRLNDGEQVFIDRMRAEQMRQAPSRVRAKCSGMTPARRTPSPPKKTSRSSSSGCRTISIFAFEAYLISFYVIEPS